MNPGKCWVFVMGAMPIMIEPEPVHGRPEPEVARAARHMPFGSVVMHVLHRGPGKAKREVYDQVVEEGNPQDINDSNVQQDGRGALELNEPAVTGIERLHKCRRGAVEFPGLLVYCERQKKEKDISYTDH